MTPVRRSLALLLSAVLLPVLLTPTAVAEPAWPGPAGWPLAGVPVVVRGFAPPAERWGAGHRGVDLSAAVGAEVLAAADGEVLFAGQVAGRPVLTIGHGALRTTYEPVRATVPVGTRVRAGQVVGRLQGGHCGTPPAACLHWGLLRGEEYLDPTLLPHDDRSTATLRLLPTGSDARARAAARTRAATVAAGATAPVGRPGAHGFVAPVAGPVTSPFGPRRHPVLGVVKLHDGTDFGVPCGTGMRAAGSGTVVERVSHPAYGERLVVDHGRVGGHRFRTSYNHALGYSVGVGEEVRRGEVVGRVGSTGYSTGCHLHLMMWVDGVLVDPQDWL